MFQTAVFIIFVFLFPVAGQAMKRPAFPLKQELKAPLISLLDSAVDLHQAFYSKKEAQIHLTSLQMARKIQELEQSPGLLPYHQGSYIYRLLQDLKPRLEAVKTPGGKRKKNIASINRDLTYVALMYGLRKYAVFFCPQDRSVWMQAERSAEKGAGRGQIKPLHLEYRSCGALVGK